MILSKKKFYVGYELISFKTGLVIKITKLYILMPVRMHLTFIQGHSYLRKSKSSGLIFSQSFDHLELCSYSVVKLHGLIQMVALFEFGKGDDFKEVL